MNFTRNHPRRIELFLLLSVLLHVALLYAIRIPAGHLPTVAPHPFSVTLAAPRAPTSRPPVQRQRAADMPTGTAKTAPVVPPNPLDTPADAAPGPSLADSSLSIAENEGKKSEQQFAAAEKTRQDTPAGRLEKYMRMPHKELTLANGMRKITTDSGSICFQPVPLFAHDQAGLFGIPMTCP